MEKRAYLRKNMSLSIVYEVKKGERPKSFKGNVQNISKGGICIVSSNLSAPNSIAMLNLTLKDTNIKVPTIAEIRWSRPVKDKKEKYKIGLQFLR